MLVIELKKDDKSKPKLYSDLRKLQTDIDTPLSKGQNYHVHKVPRFPSWMKGKVYRYTDHKMDLYNLKCDCSSQIEKQELYANRDVRSLCKHLYYKILKTSSLKEIDQLTLMLMRSAVLWGEDHLYKFRYLNHDVIFGFKEAIDWVNVYAPDKVTPELFHRYSYNPLNHRWSYDNIPEYGSLFTDLISRIIKYQLPFEHSAIKINKNF